MNNFSTTALGKSVKTGLWIVAAYLIAYATAYFAKYHWSASWAALGVPGLVNWLLYTLSVVADKSIPNLPSSQPIQIVPVSPVVVTPTADPVVPLIVPPAPPS